MAWVTAMVMLLCCVLDKTRACPLCLPGLSLKPTCGSVVEAVTDTTFRGPVRRIPRNGPARAPRLHGNGRTGSHRPRHQITHGR